MSKRLNLRVNGVEGVKIKTKDSKTLSNVVTAKKFTNFKKSNGLKCKMHLNYQQE